MVRVRGRAPPPRPPGYLRPAEQAWLNERIAARKRAKIRKKWLKISRKALHQRNLYRFLNITKPTMTPTERQNMKDFLNKRRKRKCRRWKPAIRCAQFA